MGFAKTAGILILVIIVFKKLFIPVVICGAAIPHF